MSTMFLHIFFLYIVLCVCVSSQPPAAHISADRIKKHLYVLGNDSLEGRGTGTRGCDRAAEYIRDALRSFGIAPPKSHPDYFQTFPLHGSTAIDGTELKLYGSHDTRTFRLQEDYVLYSAGAHTFTPQPVPLIFVGYGIVAPEYDYNDYGNLDIANAIVVFLSGEPHSVDSTFFDGDQPSIHSSFVLKQKIALSRGAKGSILLPNPNEQPQDDWHEQQRQFLFEEVRLMVTPSENLNVMVNPAAAPFLFSGAAYSYEEVAALDRAGTMKSFPLSLAASFQGKFIERDFLSSNVIGIIEGSDPLLKDSYLLLSAHYDHLGIGPAVEGDSIYNGVFDNASGVSALLEIARVLAHSEQPPRRSVIFLFLTGEERGFLGSQYYCLNPAVPLYTTVANINIDGLSLFERVRSVIGVGAELSALGTFLKDAAGQMDIQVEEIPPGIFRHDQFRNSDQFMFAQAGIPALLVAEGFRYESSPFEDGLQRYIQWSKEKYHSVSDDLSQPLDFDAAAQHVSILYNVALHVANSLIAPEWYPRSPFLTARLRSIAEKK